MIEAAVVAGECERASVRPVAVKYLVSLNARSGRAQAQHPQITTHTHTGAETWSMATLARPRKGGYLDAVGSSTSGDLPAVRAIAVQHEGELRHQLDGVQADLAPHVDWLKRVDAMLRLEGLVMGGEDYQSLPDLLLGLRAALVAQVGCRHALEPPRRRAPLPASCALRPPALRAQLQDRRSAVSRQACHLSGVMAQACGARFEPHALQLLPALFKAVSMSIQVSADVAGAGAASPCCQPVVSPCLHAQVVTEAADVAVQTILDYCRSPRLLVIVCGIVKTDKSTRLRQLASERLLQVRARLTARRPGSGVHAEGSQRTLPLPALLHHRCLRRGSRWPSAGSSACWRAPCSQPCWTRTQTRGRQGGAPSPRTGKRGRNKQAPCYRRSRTASVSSGRSYSRR